MSKKKLAYFLLIPLLDFIAFFAICFLSLLIAYKLKIADVSWTFYVSALVMSAIKVGVHAATGTYRMLWMYSIWRNIARITSITLLVDIVFAGLSFIPFVKENLFLTLSTTIIILLIDFWYLIVSRGILSLFLNKIYSYKRRGVERKSKRENTLIVGAGDAGSLVLNEIGEDKSTKYEVVGFVDDSNDKVGTNINGVKVYGPTAKINEIIHKTEAKNVIVAIPSANRDRLKDILQTINYKGVNVEIAPDKSKFLKRDLFNEIRKVEIADLLGREQIELDKEKLNDFISGKTILVTGGGGSIGSEIVRQVLEYHPKQVVIFDIYENTTYELKTELDMKYRGSAYQPSYIALIGSVRDRVRLEEVFDKYRPNIVFHAAAHKHVPLMEDSPYESVKNNIKGTYNVAYMANKYHVEKMVLISTDKAVRPTNVMGASKRFCEMVVESWNSKSEHTRYSMVRFGNVLGSHGSVIPLFEKQIENGGPITVTSDKITRFFMTIPEACGLVIESGAYAAGGEKFILDMGKPVKIIDLAKNMIKLSGLELGKDIDIEITGLRPGEKLYEELLLETANAEKTQNDKIYVEYSKNPFALEKIDEMIAHLDEIGHDNKQVLEYLKEIEIIKNDDVSKNA